VPDTAQHPGATAIDDASGLLQGDIHTRAELDEDLISFLTDYHHQLVRCHPFNNGNGRWSHLAADAVDHLGLSAGHTLESGNSDHLRAGV